jgi:hypothetical protein
MCLITSGISFLPTGYNWLFPSDQMVVLESEHLPHSTGGIFLFFIPSVITDIRFMILNQQQTSLCILLV